MQELGLIERTEFICLYLCVGPLSFFRSALPRPGERSRSDCWNLSKPKLLSAIMLSSQRSPNRPSKLLFLHARGSSQLPNGLYILRTPKAICQFTSALFQCDFFPKSTVLREEEGQLRL